VAEYESSPTSHVAFAERHGVRVGTFRSWLYRLREEGTSRSVEPVDASFVELRARRVGAPCRVLIGEAVFEFCELPSATYLAEFARGVAS